MFKTYGLRLIISSVCGVLVGVMLYGVFIQYDFTAPTVWLFTILCGIICSVGFYVWYGYCTKG